MVNKKSVERETFDKCQRQEERKEVNWLLKTMFSEESKDMGKMSILRNLKIVI